MYPSDIPSMVVIIIIVDVDVGHFGSSKSFFGAFGTNDSIVNNSAYTNFFPIELHNQRARYAYFLLI